MKIKAVQTIYDGKTHLPGEVYDVKKDEAARLIAMGAASEAYIKAPADDEDDDKGDDGKKK